MASHTTCRTTAESSTRQRGRSAGQGRRRVGGVGGGQGHVRRSGEQEPSAAPVQASRHPVEVEEQQEPARKLERPRHDLVNVFRHTGRDGFVGARRVSDVTDLVHQQAKIVPGAHDDGGEEVALGW